MRWMITALLQSPHFLYRSELGERQEDDSFALTSWEIATDLLSDLADHPRHHPAGAGCR